ncbi:hypothetical protein CORC01_10031 [Colletotrichum orchidophilum]|uniref:Uncharacterized protein n=1 Tax=Colletotrichum orchidophilum TaxID=1209926 RepID=A0A1G4AZN5_9PEZI|nr:uncharacterized protein CORC01_10031 [Colletotrichum orchidophilum]OHE94630.1 hypothetical protein CORC01_10031 [Colletotrichum orchidophilum]
MRVYLGQQAMDGHHRTGPPSPLGTSALDDAGISAFGRVSGQSPPGHGPYVGNQTAFLAQEMQGREPARISSRIPTSGLMLVGRLGYTTSKTASASLLAEPCLGTQHRIWWRGHGGFYPLIIVSKQSAMSVRGPQAPPPQSGV